MGNFLLPLLVASYYGVADLGLFTTILSVIILISLYLKFGMDKVLMREVAKLENVKGYIRTSIILLINLCVPLLIVILIMNQTIEKSYREYLTYCFFTSIPFTLLLLNSTVIQALGKPDIGLLFNPGLASLIMVFVLIFPNYQIGFDSLLLQYAVTLWLLLIISSIFVIKLTRQITGTSGKNITPLQRKNFRKSSFLFFIISLFLYSQQISLTFTLNFFENLSTVGLVRYAERVSLIFMFPLMIISAFISPRFSKLNYTKEKDELSKVFIYTLKICFLLAILCLATILIGWFIFHEFISDKYGGSIAFAIPFLIAQFINLTTGPSDVLLSMVGKEKFLLILTIISGITSMIIFFLGLYYLTVLYAVYFLNLIYVLRNLTQLFYALKFTREI